MQKLLLFCSGLLLTLGIGIFILPLYIRSTTHQQTNDSGRVVSPAAVVAASPEVAPLNLGTIFSDSVFSVEPSDVLLLATGDIIPARVTDAKIRAHGMFYPFEKIAGLLKSADGVISNLEAPLISNCQYHIEGMRFCGQSAFVSSLKQAGISIVTLENNHILNYGSAGKAETITHLESAGIVPVTSNNPQVTSFKDMQIGIVAVNGVGNPINLESVTKDIASLRSRVDAVIVAVHWGKEYTYDPQKAAGIAPDDPRIIGRSFIDAGADLVIGNHPHWVQGVELYKNGFITYAHGNFIFDQEWSRETTEGVIGSYLFRNKRLVNVSFIPIKITNFSQPDIADDVTSQRILDAMKTSSEKLNYSGL